jgi:hypothetical protein
MKSGKKRRQEILGRRKKVKIKPAVIAKATGRPLAYRFVPVNEALLAPDNSYGAPDFVQRGYYVDRPFRCVDCGKEELWTGTLQKWWYEVAKGFVYSTAVRCRFCRRKKSAKRAVATAHLDGIERKTHVRKKITG